MNHRTKHWLSLAWSMLKIAITAGGALGRHPGRWLIRARGGALGAVSRVSAAFMSIVGICLVGVALTSPAVAYANAPNPSANTAANVTVYNTATKLPDGETAPAGAVTINLSGSWDWQTVKGPQDCAGRYGEGLAVDWWQGKSSATLLDASQAIPTGSKTESLAYGPVSPNTSDTKLATSAGTFALSANSGGSVIYNGWNTNTASEPQANWDYSKIGATSGCTDVGTGSIGPWSATATYPSAADVPAQLCVIFYDMHGSQGTSAGGTSDLSPNTDGDNSIQTNAFDPTAGKGYCFSSNFSPNLSVVKSGPATGNPGGSGTYKLVVTNSGNYIASNVVVTDTLPGGETYSSSVLAGAAAGSPAPCAAGGSTVPGANPSSGETTISCSIPGPIGANGGTAEVDVTVTYAASDAGTTQTDCATVNGQANPSCANTVFPQQNLTGEIYLCQGGAQTTTLVPGGNLSATGPQTVSPSGASTLNAAKVLVGDYTMSAVAPSGYNFTACGGTAAVGNPPTTASQSVTVPSGGTGNGVFYVTPITQALTGHIYLCSNGSQTGSEVSGGTLSATGPQTVASAPNPLNAGSVKAGDYTMSATAPSGYQFAVCGGNATIGTPTTATEAVPVPTGGTGNGVFYVTPIVQSLTGHIYLCTSGSPSTTEVSGGTLSATGPQTIASAGNPISVTPVPAGSYTMSATAPSGYDFADCGGNATIGTPTTATETVTVPSGGTGTGIFYVTPITQSLVGHIYLCINGVPTSTEFNGGTLSATGPQNISSTSNPLSDPSVPAGTYTMTGGVPTGYQFVDCGTSNVTIGTPTTATETVTVPTGGTGTGIFYVTPTSSPGNSITLTVTKTNDANGSGTYQQSETATTAGENVPFQVVVTNTSSVPVTLTDITDSWPGQSAFSPACAQALVNVTLQPNGSATCDFTANNYAPAGGTSKTNTVNVTGCDASQSSNCVTVPATSTVITPPPTAPATNTPSAAVPAVQSSLAFTGAPEKLQLMMEIGFGMLSVGMFMLWFTRPRRLAGE
jgi:uncharacterized repeat protein (TIGR01451 family)